MELKIATTGVKNPQEWYVNANHNWMIPIDQQKYWFALTKQIQSKERFQNKWDTKTKDNVTTHISRRIRSQ